MFYIGSVLLSLAVVQIVMAIVLVTFWKMRMNALGLIEMAGAMGIGSIGALLTGIGAATTDFVFAYTGLQCFVAGVLLASRSMRRMQGLPPIYVFEVAILLICIAGDAYLIFVEGWLSGALALNSSAFVIVCGIAAYNLVTERRPELRSGCLILGCMFGGFAIVSLARAGLRVIVDLPTPTSMQVVSFDLVYTFFGIAVSLGWSLGFLWTSYSVAEYRLRAANDKLQRFSGAVAHDLNTPLNAIIGYLDAIEHLPTAAEEHKTRFIATARQAAVRMNRFIHHLLEQSRRGDAEPAPVVVDTLACIKDALEPLQYKIATAGAEVHVDKAHAVLANPFQLMRVFQNLLDNAIKYRADDRRLRIDVLSSRVGEWIHLSIRDNGHGIAAVDIGNIFKEFTRTNETSAIPGYGLGLSECRQIVASFGGTIDVQSEVGTGSTFTLKLPAPAE